MSEIVCKHKKRKNLYIIKNRIKYPEVVNLKLLKVINAGILDNFLPIDIKQKKKKGVLTCTVKGLVSLSDYAPTSIDKHHFLDIIIQLINIVKQCEKFKICSNNIELHLETIFYEPNLKRIKCIYWPIANNNTYVNIQDFFKFLPDFFNLNTSEDTDYLRRYRVFLNSIKAFSLNNFEKLVLSMQGIKNNTIDISPDSKVLGSSGSRKDNTKNSQDIAYNPVKISQEIDKINNSTIYCATLIRLSNNQKFMVEKGTTYIGSSTDSDICISDNRAISRNHAVMLKENKSFYIKDCNSTNHTYLNGRILRANERASIPNNSTITFANEDFRFSVISR